MVSKLVSTWEMKSLGEIPRALCYLKIWWMCGNSHLGPLLAKQGAKVTILERDSVASHA